MKYHDLLLLLNDLKNLDYALTHELITYDEYEMMYSQVERKIRGVEDERSIQV